MREILFKAQRTDTKDWVEGRYCKYPFSRWPLKPCIIPSAEAEDGEHMHIEVDPETVGQYTGMNDKNGKKIFENDQFIIGDAIYKVEYIAPKYVLQNIFSCDIISLENNSKKGYIKSGQRSN